MKNQFGIKKIDFDFHIHTRPGSSDSKQTVKEAIETAKEAGIYTLAITDHDSISSIKEAISLAKELDVNVIPGIEISTTILGLGEDLDYLNIHVLGLGVFPNEKNFNYLFKDVNERKEKWFKQIKEYYEKEYSINLKADNKYDLKKELVELNIFKDKKEASLSMKEQHDGVERLIQVQLSDVVDIIHRMGGIAIWAHPNRAEGHKIITPNQIEKIAKYLIERGLDGLELLHPDVTGESEAYSLIKKIAKDNDLLLSLGSDRHNSFDSYGEHYFSNHGFLISAGENYNAIKAKLLNKIEFIHSEMNIKSRLYKAAKKHDEDILKHFEDKSLSDKEYCYYALNDEIMTNIIKILLNLEMKNIASIGIDNSCRAIIEAISLINMLKKGDITDKQLKIYRYQYSLVEIDNYISIFPDKKTIDNYISKEVLDDREKAFDLYAESFGITRSELDKLLRERGPKKRLFLSDPLAFLYKTPKDKIRFESIISKYHPMKEEALKVYSYFSIFDHPRYEHSLKMEPEFMKGRMIFVNAVIEDTINYFNYNRLFLHDDLSLPSARDDLFNSEYKYVNSISLYGIDYIFDELIKNFGYFDEGTDNQSIFYLEKLRAIAKDMFVCMHRGHREQLIADFRPFAELSSVINCINKYEKEEFDFLKLGFWYNSRLQLYSYIKCKISDEETDGLKRLYEDYYKNKYNLDDFSSFVRNMTNNSLYFLDKDAKNYKKIVNENIIFSDKDHINEFKSLYKISIDLSHAGGYSFNACVGVININAFRTLIMFWEYILQYSLLQAFALEEHGYKVDISKAVSAIAAIIKSFRSELIELIKNNQ